jgi:hypothetical protein
MGLGVEVLKFVRRVAPNAYAAGMAQPHMNSRGEGLVAQALPERSEIVRLGESYGIIAATAVAPVVALPTTTAQLSLWNGEPDGGKSYIIDSLIGMVAVSAAAATGVGFAGMLNKGRVTKPTNDLAPATAAFGLAGHQYSGKAYVDLAATVVDDGWHPIGSAVVGPASQIALPFEALVYGIYIVPPGGMFSMAVLANTATTITAKQGLRWHEVQLDLG